MTTTLIGISGSVRAASFNAALLRVAAAECPPDAVFRIESIAAIPLAGASPGGFGTVLAQNAWLPVFRTLGADLWPGGRLLVSRAGGVFDDKGEMKDEAMRESVRRFVAGFVAYVRG